MPKEKILSFEREPRRKARIILVRHGEPEQYAVKDAHLSERGREQIREFARSFMESVKERLAAGQEVVIRTLYSEVLRTDDSAAEFENEVEKIIVAEDLRGVTLMTSRKRAALKTTGTLGPLINRGVPKDQLYNTWLSTDEAKLEEMGARTPSEIAGVIGDFADHLDRLTERIGNEGPEIDFVGFTHETTHGALLKAGKAIDIPKVNFAEPIEVYLAENGEPKIVFRGKEYPLHGATPE